MQRKIRLFVAASLSLVFAHARAEPPLPRSPDDLLVFVGEKESVVQFEPQLPPNVILLDGAFKARFRVLEVLHGRYDGERIEFEAYDHYARPGFANVPHSLLFLARDGQGYVQVKYQFYPVFRTATGEWAGCAPFLRGDREERRGVAPARTLAFGADAFIPLDTDWPAFYASKRFRRADYRIEGNRAYCLRGTPVRELFEAKKRGALRQDGWFGSAPAPSR